VLSFLYQVKDVSGDAIGRTTNVQLRGIYYRRLHMSALPFQPSPGFWNTPTSPTPLSADRSNGGTGKTVAFRIRFYQCD